MRIVSYGCSFTKYQYPTYADILAQDYTVDNHGSSGCGNDYIHYNLMQDFQKGNLHKYDMVIVQWTSYTRYNYLHAQRGWLGMDGSIWQNTTNLALWKTVKNIYNTQYEFDRQINYIIGAKHALDTLAANVVHMCYFPSGLDFMLYDNMFERFKGDYVFKPTTFSLNNWIDDHPTVMQHLQIAKSIAPLKNQTKSRAIEVDTQIRQNKNFVKIDL